ncbi:MAG TPA: hypothetical protein VJ761_14385 [Ktedonobacteraceae bacterium]|nr:hypothetical protein [Ktedonobacteraceae bacterium]
MATLSDPIIERIQREAGIPELIDVLAERLDPTDLQSLLLEVYRRRAVKIKPGQLLERYEQDRFVRLSEVAPQVLTDFDRLVWSLLPDDYTAVELSPVCPLGTNAAVATVDQNKVVTTIRNSEVIADVTNVLALECASHRRRLLRINPRNRDRVRLCASQRVVRGQAFQNPDLRPHFRLLGLCVAGRDEGAFQFETTSLVEHVTFYLNLLRETAHFNCAVERLRVTLTDLDQGRWERALKEHVLSPLMATYPDVPCELDPDRKSGRGYYAAACFHVYATNSAGTEFELVDGGFTTWTQHMLSNTKERLLISGLGIERLCVSF